MLVFDKAYNFYRQFAYWTNKHIYFVTRQKTNAIYTVMQTLVKKSIFKSCCSNQHTFSKPLSFDRTDTKHKASLENTNLKSNGNNII